MWLVLLLRHLWDQPWCAQLTDDAALFKKSSVIQTTTCDSGQTLLNRTANSAYKYSPKFVFPQIWKYTFLFPHKQALFGCAARYLNCNPRNCVSHLRFFYFESLLSTNQSDPALPVSAGCHLAESLSSKLMFMCRYAKITDAAEQNENYCRSLPFRPRRCIWTPIHYLLSPSMLLLQIK